MSECGSGTRGRPAFPSVRGGGAAASAQDHGFCGTSIVPRTGIVGGSLIVSEALYANVVYEAEP